MPLTVKTTLDVFLPGFSDRLHHQRFGLNPKSVSELLITVTELMSVVFPEPLGPKRI
ncbi:MAG: hypothetical protein ABSB40_09400 [Nitrososphaeria archaeon]